MKTQEAQAVLHSAMAAIAAMTMSACAADSSEPPTERRVSPLGGGPACFIGPSCPRYNEEKEQWDWWGYWCQEGEQSDWLLMWCENEVLEQDVDDIEAQGGDPNVWQWKGRVFFRRASGNREDGTFYAANVKTAQCGSKNFGAIAHPVAGSLSMASSTPRFACVRHRSSDSKAPSLVASPLRTASLASASRNVLSWPT